MYEIPGGGLSQSIMGRNSTAHQDKSTLVAPRRWLASPLKKRVTCRYHQIKSGEGCPELVGICGISGYDLERFNSKKKNFCASLMPGDYVCCSAGDPYVPPAKPKPDPPKRNSDGTCATHLIKNLENCTYIGETYGVEVKDLEKWNQGKTWGWTKCDQMMASYTMCISDGDPPLPAPQQGTECGPQVPGTVRLANKSVSMADLNPCPLKACCSNWGYCGPFSEHCEIHAPPGGGPGTKVATARSTCISNCGMDIKKNSGPPAEFQRIGYYESFSFERECLRGKVGEATADPSYTHVHWAFATTDPQTWKPVIKDPGKQWDAFKQLPLGMNRVVSFGGWAYSTEPAIYKILRDAVLLNSETFATNIAKFLVDEDLDGVDIDWEYPGAPDIYANGQLIGKKGDGIKYLSFLTALKKKLAPGKSLSIAVPALYWYLKDFPIDSIAKVVDYIVYMTYDLHGQWDYGNTNAFDNCLSGKCIRSYVNLTETRNAFAISTLSFHF